MHRFFCDDDGLNWYEYSGDGLWQIGDGMHGLRKYSFDTDGMYRYFCDDDGLNWYEYIVDGLRQISDDIHGLHEYDGDSTTSSECEVPCCPRRFS